MQHTIVQQVTTPDGTVGGSRQVSADAAVSVDQIVPPTTNDVAIVFTLDVSQVKSFMMVSDQDLTFEGNNSGAGVPVIALKKDVPYIWTVDSYNAFLLTTDITTFFLSNAGAIAANFKLRALYDPTI